MNRTTILESVRQEKNGWDILVVGGGATGLGTALDSASRGYKTLLIEQHDFSKGTSSRSTKLIHGGVRYLRQGNISLVLEALKERSVLSANAPHIVRNLSFVIPGYRWWEKPFYGTGLKIYDALAGRNHTHRSATLTAKQTLKEIPTLNPGNLTGGIRYFDGQFDDSRLAVNLMQSIYDQNGIALNYVKATGILKKNGMIRGVEARDMESGETFPVRAKTVVNATGVFSDNMRQMDNPENETILQLSQGAHIVLDRSFQPGDSALMIPRTEDGRVLFAIPWHNRVIIGTTDTPVESANLEPRPLDEELDFLLLHAARYLTRGPEPEDVKSVYAGLRPLVRTDGKSSTKKLSRDHTILTDPSGLVTVTGGKWTTYRKMAQETVDQAVKVARLEKRACRTETLQIHGWTDTSRDNQPYQIYGSDADAIHTLENEQEGWDIPLHPDLPYRPAEIVWAIRHEMARTVEDILSRRTRALLIDADASIKIARPVARLIASELDLNSEWEVAQVRNFENLARGYLLQNG